MRIGFFVAALFVISSCADQQQQIADQEQRTDEIYPIGKSGQILTTRYGNGLPMTVYLPQDADKPVPVLIFNHGREFSEDLGRGEYKRSKTDPLVTALNRVGIAAAFPVRRGYWSAPGVNGERIDCNRPTKVQYRKALESGKADIVAAVKAMSNLPEVDANNVFVAGQSAGGFLTLGSLDAYPDNVRAAISFNGGRCGKRGPLFRGIEFAEKLISSAAASSNVPVMLVASTNDKIIPYQSSVRIKDAICSARNGCETVKLLESEGTGHSEVRTAFEVGDEVAAYLASRVYASN